MPAFSAFSRLMLLSLFSFCSSLYAQTAQINEFASDATMYDGSGGEFIELYCPAGGGACDVSCWKISDGQGVITLPSNTSIPAGGFYLIAYAPAFSCDSCDFFGIPIDLNLKTCNCLTGGAFTQAIDGGNTMSLGVTGNNGEMLYLFNQNNILQEGLKFDNASGTSIPLGGSISYSAANGCSSGLVHLTNPNNPQITNVGGTLLGCNTSFARSTDGGAIWIADNHPSPRASNPSGGSNGFDYQYSIDGGAWQTLVPTATTGNTQTANIDLCAGNTIAFRTNIRNYQHIVRSQYDGAGLLGSFFESDFGGRADWANVSGLGAANGGSVTLFTNDFALPVGNSYYTLQWSDYKNGLGSGLSTSTNECYERMNVSVNRRDTILSALVQCTDPFTGLNTIQTNPSALANATYNLYDDAGGQINLIQSNQNGFFSLPAAALPTVAYYVVVTTPCHTLTASTNATSFCRANPPCPAFTTDTLKINGTICASACSACPADILSLYANGTDLPGGGTIQWYSSNNPIFNPYAGEGNFIGQVNIPNIPVCYSATTRINEIMYRPSARNTQDPNAGEFLELIGTPGANIGCTVITDGDWTITIPQGTTIPLDGIFSIGNTAIYGIGSVDLDAENCGCFTEGFGGNGLLGLTDGGEYVAMFNAAGAFQQGVIWGTPSAGNTPPNGANSVGGVINTRGLAGCPASVTIPSTGYTTLTGGVTANTSLITSPDGSNTWSSQAGGSLNRCNDAPPPVTVSALSTSLSTADCNQTLYLKGILKPHPNTAACANTTTQASTRTYQLNINCPTATLTSPSLSVCDKDAPVNVQIQTSGIANGAIASAQLTRNGAIISPITGTVGSGSLNIPISASGIYTLTGLTSAGNCPASTSGSTSVQVVPTPNIPITAGTAKPCDNAPATLAVSGGTTYEWSTVSDFSVIVSTTDNYTDLFVNPITVYVRAKNDATLPPAQTCVSQAKSISVQPQICFGITYPLTWLNFEAEQASESSVQLHWQTGTETNTSHFLVEHSTDAQRFVNIGRVSAAGNSNQVRSYDFFHLQPKAGWNYYRLYQADTDGRGSFSRVVAVFFDTKTDPYFTIYPNPVPQQNGQVTVQILGQVLRKTRLYIYDNLGQIVYEQALVEGQNTYQIPTQSLAKGTYSLLIQNNLNTYSQKFVRE